MRRRLVILMLAVLSLSLAPVVALAQPSESGHGTKVERAVAVLQPIGDSGASGVVHFTQEGDKVKVEGTITGLKPGQHGFHVHEYGDLTDRKAGLSAGSHYNPTDMPHGHRTDENRHVGDFGNIEANPEGVATFAFTDPVIELNGPHAIIGRGLVIHAEADKFTQPQGDAGDRVAMGVIGIAQPAP
ncbi:MAG: superoxide dismutase family protein [Thermoguttaceae bacterium]|jgi:Cu-Zn family superoxide dismutase